MTEQLSEEEMKLRDLRLTWGEYCVRVEDVSFARFQEILASAPTPGFYADAEETTGPVAAAPKKGRRK